MTSGRRSQTLSPQYGEIDNTSTGSLWRTSTYAYMRREREKARGEVSRKTISLSPRPHRSLCRTGRGVIRGREVFRARPAQLTRGVWCRTSGQGEGQGQGELLVRRPGRDTGGACPGGSPLRAYGMSSVSTCREAAFGRCLPACRHLRTRCSLLSPIARRSVGWFGWLAYGRWSDAPLKGDSNTCPLGMTFVWTTSDELVPTQR